MADAGYKQKGSRPLAAFFKCREKDGHVQLFTVFRNNGRIADRELWQG